MRSKHPILTFVIFIFLAGFAYGQQTVTLVCNPAAIDESGATGACYFVGGEDVNPEEFTTFASVGETITWEGQSTSEDDSIDVFMIKYQGGVNVFNREELPGEAIVQGRVERATPDNEPYKYEIRFKVNSTGRLYKIDPIIRSK